MFTHPFLSQFFFAPEALSLKDRDIVSLDKELSQYEQVFMNPEVEQSLISKNELLASFAISKAESSQLTLREATDIYKLLIADKKLTIKQKLTQKNHDKLEFFNIAHAFRSLNQSTFSFKDLNPDFIRDIHRQITGGLDVFAKYLPDFTVYKAGRWRDNDLIRVGDYIPAPAGQIARGITELIAYMKAHQTITGVAVFHSALYALHPFNNGNKRVCRILEHLLLRALGLNNKNLYSTSYYYHTQKKRYYKYLLYALQRKNLNHFVSFILEALALSIVSVVKTSVEIRRNEFLQKRELDGTAMTVLKPLIKRHELQFKHLARAARGKLARQTLVNALQKAVEAGVLLRREHGRAVYYRLNVSIPEYETLERWIGLLRDRLPFVPDDIRLI
ncbi:Fic family protein [Candidatus Gottesmanbacteria bacterium]|nr:Fic family protein [Candidatus Gottesmanbacteria bacterium]